MTNLLSFLDVDCDANDSKISEERRKFSLIRICEF